ncbi:replication-relaxation family protein [Kitasatospora sp. NBC_01302]|uniref:replication-relaxation family protein n=1 Tax=Kitasatospora sp. NBC_01302 TaxID=2903575 RepID=UPI002E138DCD|nr:replication-relaxation family protein [Kitasatospora sp. NBC_01302]
MTDQQQRLDEDQQHHDQAAAAQSVPAARSWARSRENPNGSTGALRGDVLAALAVVKVATADQLQRIVRPNAAGNKVVRAALLDLGLHGLTAADGRTADREKLWRLTTAGLEAALEVLPTGREPGRTARGAGRTGAPHTRMVTETIIAVLQGGTDPDAGPGTGTITDWSTETVHEVGPKLRAITDAVLRAPQLGYPALMFEVDRGTMSPETVAGKFERYRRYYLRTSKGLEGGQIPYWQQMYGPAPTTRWERTAPWPPVLLVFGGALGPVALANRIEAVERLSRPYWAPQPTRNAIGTAWDEYDYNDYTDRIPILATTLDRLRAKGLTGDQAWHRFGHQQAWQDLEAALADPDGRGAWYQRDEERREQQRLLGQEREHEVQPARWPDEHADSIQAADSTPCQDGTAAHTGQERHQTEQQQPEKKRRRLFG